MLIQRRRLTILPSSQDVSEENWDGLTECPARGKHTMHVIVAFMSLWLIPFPVIYLFEALLCSLAHQWYSGFGGKKKSLYPQPDLLVWTPKTTVFSIVYTRFLLFLECEEVVRECWLYLTLKERWGSKEPSELFFREFLTDLSLQAPLCYFEALHPAEVPSPSSTSILETHVCALWFTFQIRRYHVLTLSLFLYCHVTSPLWLYGKTCPLLCSGNLRNTCLE